MEAHATDKALLVEALRSQAISLQHLGELQPDWCSDREIVLAAVEQNGAALRHAATLLQDDGGLVAAALRNDGFALAFVAPESQDQALLLPALQWHVARVARVAEARARSSSAPELGQICDWVQQCMFLSRGVLDKLGANEGLAVEILRLELLAPSQCVKLMFGCFQSRRSDGFALGHANSSLLSLLAPVPHSVFNRQSLSPESFSGG